MQAYFVLIDLMFNAVQWYNNIRWEIIAAIPFLGLNNWPRLYPEKRKKHCRFLLMPLRMEVTRVVTVTQLKEAW